MNDINLHSKIKLGILNIDTPFEWGVSSSSKVQGLIELMKIGIPVPETFIINAYDIVKINEANIDFLILNALQELELITGLEIGGVYGLPNQLTFAVRAGEKRNFGVYLPPSILNVGYYDNFKLAHEYKQHHHKNFNRDAICQSVIECIKGMATKISSQGGSDPWILLQRMRSGKTQGYSFSGAGYTRNPHTCKLEYYGFFCENKNGHEYYLTPIKKRKKLSELKQHHPEILEIFSNYNKLIENYYSKPRYIEFVCENGSLYYVQNSVSRHNGSTINNTLID